MISAVPIATESRFDAPLTIRKAAMADIHDLLNVINNYAASGIMLPRTEFEISGNIRDFTVAYSGSQLLGCGALHFYTPLQPKCVRWP